MIPLDQDTSASILAQLQKLKSRHFYKPLQPHDHQYLEKFKHMVALYLNLPTNYLFLTKTSESNFISVYVIDNVCYCASHLFAEEVVGTIFECHIIDNKACILSDILVYKGTNQESHSMTYRYQLMKTSFEHHYLADPLIDSMQVNILEFVKFEDAVKLWQRRTKAAVGLLFRPNIKNFKNFYLINPTDLSILKQIQNKQLEMKTHTNESSKPNTDSVKTPNSNAIKVKTTDLETRTFVLVPDHNPNKPDVYHLYAPSDRKKHGIAVITSLATSIYVAQAFQREVTTNAEANDKASMGTVLAELTFRCQYVKRFRRWEPIELIEV